MENKESSSHQSYSYHIALNRPILLIKSSAIDKVGTLEEPTVGRETPAGLLLFSRKAKNNMVSESHYRRPLGDSSLVELQKHLRLLEAGAKSSAQGGECGR